MQLSGVSLQVAYLMNNLRYLVIEKKDDVYLKIDADESIRREFR